MGNAAKRNGRTVSMGAGIGAGLLFSLITTLLGAAIIAVLLDREVLPWERVGYGIMVLLPIAAAAGTQIACSRIRRQRMAVCLISAAAFWLTLLGATALFFGGQYDGAVVTGGLIIAGSGCVMLLGGRENRAGKRRTGRKLPR